MCRKDNSLLAKIKEETTVVFLVRAKNKHGLSPPSILSNEMATLSKTPQSKYNMDQHREEQSTGTLILREVIILGQNKVKFVWQTLEHYMIKGFHIHIQEMTSEESSSLNTITIMVAGGYITTHVINYLKADTQYIAIMAPFWDSINGKPSIHKTFRTKESAPTGYPENVLLKFMNSTTAIVSWKDSSANQQPFVGISLLI